MISAHSNIEVILNWIQWPIYCLFFYIVYKIYRITTGSKARVAAGQARSDTAEAQVAQLNAQLEAFRAENLGLQQRLSDKDDQIKDLRLWRDREIGRSSEDRRIYAAMVQNTRGELVDKYSEVKRQSPSPLLAQNRTGPPEDTTAGALPGNVFALQRQDKARRLNGD